ncbi:hypothetical protein SLOPH_531 [Spraguea lophii 42_110]|uniref:Uncharacterized protein n=1 Tax=Spraguea lophii (strain 42_110) TaxID=1358809 RepID=S7XVE3_SPRLO|nr:hypothetical protein SLOPH_531 [Spraguea lophii 42_110]
MVIKIFLLFIITRGSTNNGSNRKYLTGKPMKNYNINASSSSGTKDIEDRDAEQTTLPCCHDEPRLDAHYNENLKHHSEFNFEKPHCVAKNHSSDHIGETTYFYAPEEGYVRLNRKKSIGFEPINYRYEKYTDSSTDSDQCMGRREEGASDGEKHRKHFTKNFNQKKIRRKRKCKSKHKQYCKKEVLQGEKQDGYVPSCQSCQQDNEDSNPSKFEIEFNKKDLILLAFGAFGAVNFVVYLYSFFF